MTDFNPFEPGNAPTVAGLIPNTNPVEMPDGQQDQAPAPRPRGRPRRTDAAPAAPAASRGRGRPPKAAANGATPVEARVRTGRKGRTTAPAILSGSKIDVTTALGAFIGLKPEDANMLGKMVTALQGLGKDSRTRILDALGKIFG